MQLWDLFQGYEKAYGTYEIKRVKENGKNEGRANTISAPITQNEWDAHIAGTGPGVGIIPLKADDTVSWGVIDIDVNTINHTELEKQCRAMEMPLVICRSKSGGAHCFVFLKEPAAASIVVSALSSFAASLGYGGAEIFPKQTTRYNESDIGNWLNMPYYNADRTSRFCYHNGQELELQEFCDFAESMMVTEADLADVKPKSAKGEDLNSGMFEEGPPCLQLLQSMGGFPEGTRNDGMFNVAVYLRKRFPDDWSNKLQEYNLEMCDPPLPLQDINNTQKSVDRKSYEYRCKLAPINAHCHRRLCMRRRYGVGETSDGGKRPEILDVKMVNSDPPLWYMTVNGKRIQLETEQFLNQTAFNTAIAKAIQRNPTKMPPPRFDRFVDELMTGCEVEEVPIDLTPYGQFLILLEGYLLGVSKTTTKDDLRNSNHPFMPGDGTVWFKMAGLMKYLDTHGYRYKSMSHLGQMMRDAGATPSTSNIKGKSLNLWKMPVPASYADEQETKDTPKFGTTDF
jgi:hypothetical protein